MNRILRIILIFLGIVVAFCVITFADIKITARIEHIADYNRCIERSKKVPLQVPEQFKDCVARGGCFDSCGSSCGGTHGYLPTTNLIFGTSNRACIAMCVPNCIEKP